MVHMVKQLLFSFKQIQTTPFFEKLKSNAPRLPSESDHAAKQWVNTSKYSQKYVFLSLVMLLLFNYIVVDMVC